VAIKILTRVLWKAANVSEIHLSSIKGGDKHNAIPREASAVIATPATKTKKVIDLIKEEGKYIAEEIKPIDPNLKVDIKNCDLPKTIVTDNAQGKALNLLHALPHGVDKMSYDIPDLVETSTNLATVTTEEKKLAVGLSSRSSIMSALQDFRDRIHAVATLAGAKVTENTPYPGWKPNLDSKVLARSKTIFKNMFGEEPKVEAIHAGLECGIIGEKFPGMDMISIGPTIKYPHSPEEQVHISTVEKFYDYVKKILEYK
jgi:dipeptidase D